MRKTLCPILYLLLSAAAVASSAHSKIAVAETPKKTAAVSTTNHYFDAAKHAYESRQYKKALTLFLQAKKNGYQHASLEYNIAVCYFKTHNYAQANKTFSSLLSQKAWQALAQYNLGLVALADGKTTEAKQWFERSVQAENPKIKAISQKQLNRLHQSIKPLQAASPGTTLLALSFGADSNAASLTDELIRNNNKAKDSYQELLGFSQGYINGTTGNGISLYGFGYLRHYNEFESFNNNILGVGINKEFELENFGMTTGMRYTHTQVDGKLLTGLLQGNIAISRASANSHWRLAYLPGQYFAGDQYAHLEGTQHRFEAQWQPNISSPLSWKLRYRFELNDRKDLQTDTGFTSYSPARHAIKAALKWETTKKLTSHIAYEYIRSQYPDSNEMRVLSGETISKKRSGTKGKFEVGLFYKITDHWRVKASLQKTTNDDNIDVYDYDKNVVSGTLELVL